MKKQRSFAVIFENFQTIYHEIKYDTILAFTKSNAGHPLFVFTDEKILVRPTNKSKEKPFDIYYSDIYMGTIQKKPMLVYFKTKNSTYTVWDIKNKNLAEIIRAQVKIKNSEIKTFENETSNQQHSEKNIRERFKDLTKKEPMLIVKEVKKHLEANEITRAEKIILKIENEYDEFRKNENRLRQIKTKTRKLTDRLADGEIDSDSYKKAFEDLEKQEKEIEEKLWKLRNKLFKDEYEKPF